MAGLCPSVEMPRVPNSEAPVAERACTQCTISEPDQRSRRSSGEKTEGNFEERAARRGRRVEEREIDYLSTAGLPETVSCPATIGTLHGLDELYLRSILRAPRDIVRESTRPFPLKEKGENRVARLICASLCSKNK